MLSEQEQFAVNVFKMLHNITSFPNLFGACESGKPGAWRENSQRPRRNGPAHPPGPAGEEDDGWERVRWRGQCLCGQLNDERMNGCSSSHCGSSPRRAFHPQPGHFNGAGEIGPSANPSRKHTLEPTPEACGLSRGVRNPRGRGQFPWGDYWDVNLRG